MKGLILAVASIALSVLFVAPASGSLVALEPFEPIYIYDANGELLLSQELEPTNPLLIKTVHYYRLAPSDMSSGGPKPGGGSDPGTDCESDAYRVTGWFWDQPYSGLSASYASTVNSAGNSWDAVTGAGILSGISSGKQGEAGTFDGVNQLEWELIGASSTVAVTTTWSYRGSGIAVESDGQYNTYYPWSTSGASNAMDVQGVATHEIGHTFGLDHPNGGGAGCLTMYAYVNYGETHQRTLGDGDILGLRSIYGA